MSSPEQHFGGGGGKPHFPPGYWQLGDWTQLQVALIVVCTIALSLALLFTGLRLWSRGIKRLRLQWNDHFILAACALDIGFFIVQMINTCSGAARDLKDLRNPPEQIKFSVKYIYPTQAVLWASVNTSVKLSMADLYIRIFPSKGMRIAVTVFSVATMLNFIFALVVAVVPGNATDIPAKSNSFIASAAINLILDVIIITMPMPLLSKLQLRRSKKLSLIGIFALGFAITGVSIARVIVFESNLKNITGGRGFGYNTFVLPLTSFLETSLSIVNACLPVIFPAVISIARKFSIRLSYGTRPSRNDGYDHMHGSYAARPSQRSVAEPNTASFFGWWRQPRVDKSLPALPQSSRGVQGFASDKALASYDLKDLRESDEESGGSPLPVQVPPNAVRRTPDGGVIAVEREWDVAYERPKM